MPLSPGSSDPGSSEPGPSGDDVAPEQLTADGFPLADEHLPAASARYDLQPPLVAVLLVALGLLAMLTVTVVWSVQTTHTTAPDPGILTKQAALAPTATALTTSTTVAGPLAVVPNEAGSTETQPTPPPPSSAPTSTEAPAARPYRLPEPTTSSTPPPQTTQPPPVRTTAPAAPSTSELAAVPVSLSGDAAQTSAEVRWGVSGPTTGLAGFQVVFSGGGRTVQQQVGAEARASQVSGLSPGTGYVVTVTSVGLAGPDPAATGTLGLATLPETPPSSGPSGLTLTAGPGSLTVTWSADPADQATRAFFVSWGCCGGYLDGVTVDRSVRSYTISGLRSNVSHVVEVQSLDADMQAVPSTKRTVTGTPQ